MSKKTEQELIAEAIDLTETSLVRELIAEAREVHQVFIDGKLESSHSSEEDAKKRLKQLDFDWKHRTKEPFMRGGEDKKPTIEIKKSLKEAISDDKAKKAERVFTKAYLDLQDKNRDLTQAQKDDPYISHKEFDDLEDQKDANVAKAVNVYGKVRDYAAKHKLPGKLGHITGEPEGFSKRVSRPMDLGYEFGKKMLKQSKGDDFHHTRYIDKLNSHSDTYQERSSKESDPAKKEHYKHLSSRLRAFAHGMHSAKDDWDNNGGF
jgi:hypothetical protein